MNNSPAAANGFNLSAATAPAVLAGTLTAIPATTRIASVFRDRETLTPTIVNVLVVAFEEIAHRAVAIVPVPATLTLRHTVRYSLHVLH